MKKVLRQLYYAWSAEQIYDILWHQHAEWPGRCARRSGKTVENLSGRSSIGGFSQRPGDSAHRTEAPSGRPPCDWWSFSSVFCLSRKAGSQVARKPAICQANFSIESLRCASSSLAAYEHHHHSHLHPPGWSEDWFPVKTMVPTPRIQRHSWISWSKTNRKSANSPPGV